MSDTAKKLELLNREYESLLSVQNQLSSQVDATAKTLQESEESLMKLQDATELAHATLHKPSTDEDKNTAKKNIRQLEDEGANLRCDIERNRAMLAALSAERDAINSKCEQIAALLAETAEKS